MAKKPEHRYQTMAEMVDALEADAGGLRRSPTPGRRFAARLPMFRQRLM